MDDAQQQKIIGLTAPSALVLAGPGCGKTHILARRIFHASSIIGIPLEKMLCLTFTNRAAREMIVRVETYFGSVPKSLFIGNLHRFCLRFLFANQLIYPDTSVLDDEDHALFAEENPGYSSDISGNDETAAEAYRRFKEENHLIDYDDILSLAYTALSESKPGELLMTGYRWIQVDEVQDLSPLQLAIIELISAPDAQIMYLGDEQQAIFGFTGAGRQALEHVKARCNGQIFHLRRNYRSPRQLTDVCNDYAVRYLDIAGDLLPESVNGNGGRDCLRIYTAPGRRLTELACALARTFTENSSSETTAILVRTNYEGEKVSDALESHGIKHLLIGKQDLFRGADFKTVWSHLAVVHRPERLNGWARLIYRCRGTRTLSGARKLVADLRKKAVCPDMLLNIDVPTDIERLAGIFADPDITVAVLDIEATGSDVFNDDIAHISAVRMRAGKLIPGSEFIYAQTAASDPVDGLRQFIDYLGDAIPVGHNLRFGLQILRNNILRYPQLKMPAALQSGANAIDTQRLSRLLFPHLWSHKLNYLLSYLSLHPKNSAKTGCNAAATAELLYALAGLAADYAPIHSMLRTDTGLRRIAERFSKNYASLHSRTRSMLDNPAICTGNTICGAVKDAYAHLLSVGAISPIPHFTYLTELISQISATTAPYLREHLQTHLAELLSFNEGDLFAQGLVRERLVVLTVHKAKGMEMDNIIIHDASESFGKTEEIMRVLYVAMSRARRRLAIGFSSDPRMFLGELADRFTTITPDEQKMLLMKEHGNKLI